jgi:DNA-binding NarL/FixJ family response regulator
MTTGPTLRVLAVSEDHATRAAIEHVTIEDGDRFEGVVSIESAVSSAVATPIDVAFVDLTTDGGAAIALCHHLPGVSPGVVVHVIVAPRDFDRGAEALSLGAAGLIVAPPTGDALARVLADVKANSARAQQVSLLEERLKKERRRVEVYDRLVRLARGAAQTDAIRAIVEGVFHLSGAKGVALYAPPPSTDSEKERVRVAAVGSAFELPAGSQPADLSRLAQARHARVQPLIAGTTDLGTLVIDQAPGLSDVELTSLSDLAAAMLSLTERHEHVDDSVRVSRPKHFRAVADRMLALAARHDRRACMLAISLPGPDRTTRREEATLEIADIVRNSDALCGTEDGDLLVFLPETTSLGAHTCRRRILARLSGDRRARPTLNLTRALDPHSKGPTITIGVATYPHDGPTLDRLIRTARARAYDDGRSPVHVLSLDILPLADVVDALIARPMLDAGPRSPYPLDVPGPALFAIVARACREALRGGEALVTTTQQSGLGVAAAARQVTVPRIVDARAERGCADVEAIVVEAEHGTWVCCGRLIGDRFRGVHCADPLLADILTRRLLAAGGSDAR